MADLTAGMVVLALSLAASAVGVRYALRTRRVGGEVRRDAWKVYAAERGWLHHDELAYPRMRGEHRGCGVEVGARIGATRARGRRRETATTEIRVPLRAASPYGLHVHRRDFASNLAFRLLGGKTVSIDEDIDAFFQVAATDAAAARELLSDLEVKKALLRLVDALPEARVTAREVVVDLDGMVTDTAVLERYLDAMTGVAMAIRAIAPERPRTAEAAAPLPTAAELPPLRERLGSVLRRLGPPSSLTGLQTASLRVAPYDYEIEVRGVGPATTRLGIETPGRLVRGLVERSEWRIELTVAPEWDALVDALETGDRITGTLQVDELRAVSRTLEGHAIGCPVPVGVPRGTTGPPDGSDQG